MKRETICIMLVVVMMLIFSVPVEALENDSQYSNAEDFNINKETTRLEDNRQMITNEVLNGWFKESGYTYYYVNGVRVQGFQEIDGKTYFFSYVTSALKKDCKE